MKILLPIILVWIAIITCGFLVARFIYRSIVNLLPKQESKKKKQSFRPSQNGFIRNSQINELPKDPRDWTPEQEELSIRHLQQVADGHPKWLISRDEEYYMIDLYDKNGGGDIWDWDEQEIRKVIAFFQTDTPLSSIPDSMGRGGIPQKKSSEVGLACNKFQKEFLERTKSNFGDS